MNRLRQVFGHRHVILPVVHVRSLDQASRNTQAARAAAADGVFLIDHGMRVPHSWIHQGVAGAQSGG